MTTSNPAKRQLTEPAHRCPWKLPIIDSWYVSGGHLMGIVRNHPKLPDDTYIFTSKLLCLGSYLALTHSNHWYQLGTKSRQKALSQDKW